MLDTVIAGGDVVDGSGRPAFRADVGIRGGRIAAVGDLGSAVCGERVDARGQVVCPGFVDIHTHSDLTLLANPRGESGVHQGVTTQVVGNCGLGVAPVLSEMRDAVRASLAFLAADVEWDWESFGDYLDRLGGAGLSLNAGSLASHGALRARVMGFAERPATPAERDRIAAEARRALDAGALGISSGLIYTPSMYADSDELVALGRVVREAGATYTTHIRNEGDRLLPSIEEAVQVARRSGARTEICHLKASGRPNWGRVRDAAALVEEARTAGASIAFDLYPYTAGSTMLSTLLPKWVVQGTVDDMVGRLGDAVARAAILEEMGGGRATFRGSLGVLPYPWEKILITSVQSEANRGVEGKSVAQIAGEWGVPAEESALRLLAEERGQVNMALFTMCEEDVEFLLAHPLACVISDGLAYAPYGSLSRGRPHPRCYGTYPRLLGHYVREKGILSLEDAIRRSTSEPAARMGIRDRGLLREGFAADLVLFDPGAIRDTATYTEPHQYPEGIALVLVNGEVVVRDGEHTGARPGQVIRRLGGE